MNRQKIKPVKSTIPLKLYKNTEAFPSQSKCPLNLNPPNQQTTSKFHPPPSKSKLPFAANPKSISKPNITPFMAPKSKPLSRSQLKNTDHRSQYTCQNASPRLQKVARKVQISNSGNPLLLKLVSPNASFISPIGKSDLLATVVVAGEDVVVDKVRTPPVEASVSPDIQCGSHSKILASKSGATPVCYGAGHLLSGVTDRRKCRRRGSLKGGFQNPLDYTTIDVDDDSSVPLLAGASVRWHLSPQDQRNGDDQASGDLGNKVLLSDLVCHHVNCSGVDNVASDDVLDCRQSLEFNRVLEFPNKVMEEQFSATSHNSFKLSTGSLSSGNMIQTPNSDSSSDWFLGRSEAEIDKTDFVESDINLLTSMWGAPDFGDMALPSDSGDLIKVQKNEDCVSSWVSDATVGNLGLSQMRISWRDGLESMAFEREELDCCWCLSDEEEINAKCGAIVENHLETEDDDLSPEILDYEPIISDKQKGKASPHLTNTCAESIFTNGSSLFASEDSDWTGRLSNNSYLKFSTRN